MPFPRFAIVMELGQALELACDCTSHERRDGRGLFALEHEGLVFVVREISAVDIASSVEPGFALIRESFRWN